VAIPLTTGVSSPRLSASTVLIGESLLFA